MQFIFENIEIIVNNQVTFPYLSKSLRKVKKYTMKKFISTIL